MSEDYTTPDGSHPIYYAFALALKSAFKAQVAADDAVRRGQFSAHDREAIAKFSSTSHAAIGGAISALYRALILDDDPEREEISLLDEVADLEEAYAATAEEICGRTWRDIVVEVFEQKHLDIAQRSTHRSTGLSDDN